MTWLLASGWLATTLLVGWLVWSRRDSIIPLLMAQVGEALERERKALQSRADETARADAATRAATAEGARANAAEGTLGECRAVAVSGLHGDALAAELVRVLSEAGSAAPTGADHPGGTTPYNLLDPWPDSI